MKPLQFPQKSTYTQYQPDLLQKAVSSDQSQLKTQQQYNVNWPISDSNAPTLTNVNHPNHNNEEILPEKDAIAVLKDAPVHDRKKDGKNLLIQNKSESKSTEDSDYNNEDEEETTTEPPRKKKKHRKVNKIGKQPTEQKAESNSDSAMQQLKMVHSDLKVEFMDHDGEADRPGGAVVSLALGKKVLWNFFLLFKVNNVSRSNRPCIFRHFDYNWFSNGYQLSNDSGSKAYTTRQRLCT